MGRYYFGDISGKFVYGVQRSDDPNFFSIKAVSRETFEDGMNSPVLHYHFDKSMLPEIEKGMSKCKKELEKHKKNLNKNDKDTKDDTIWEARMYLGNKILECVKDKGVCIFEAEL